jgi:hypothetical protein
VIVLGLIVHRFTRSGSIFDARQVAAAGIHVYQRSLSPLAARVGIRCRFTPTCSRYAEVVIQRDGVLRGGWLAIKRVARCGPWTTPGTQDEP